MNRPRVNQIGIFGIYTEKGDAELVGMAVIVSDAGCTVEQTEGDYVFFEWDDFSYFIPSCNTDSDVIGY